MNITLAISSDERFLRLQADRLETTLTAEDVENLISQLAEQRKKMMPGIGQSRKLGDDGLPIIDDILPDLETVLMVQTPPVVVVAVGFQGLGWRNISLSVDQAEAFADQLLAQTRTARRS